MKRVFNSGVIAVIRTNNSEDALLIARALNDTIVDAIEITMTVPNALEVIETLINEGAERIGAGTVRTVEQVNAVAKVGGQFVVSPHSNREIIEAAVKNKLQVTPGTATPTEMMQALAWGATSVKVFPIWAFGGLEYIKSVLEPLPDLPIVVSGGATPEEVKEYLKLGVKGVCLGGALWDQSIVSMGSVSAAHAYAVDALSRI